MAIADIASQLSSELPWRTCAVCHALDSMSDTDAATFRDLLADRGVRFKTLAKQIEDDPDLPDIPWEALSRHARAGCSAKERLR